MSRQAPLDREAARARVGEARARHHQRPMVLRVASALAGFVLLVVAVALVWLPEVGIPLALVALRLLALEFDWAVGAQSWLILTWARVRDWFAGLSLPARFAWSAVLAIVLVGLIVLIFGS